MSPARRTFAALLSLALCLAALPAGAATDAPGIDFENRPQATYLEPETEQAFVNPHDMPCEECHLPKGGAADYGSVKHGGDTIELCRDCHEDNLHPVKIPVAGVTDAPPADLPLGTGSLAGKITCLTCHDIHQRKVRGRLLRVVGAEAKGRIESLCAACHGSRLKEKSPHLGEGSGCHLCHMNKPRPGQGTQGLGANVQAVCNFCHDALDNKHFLALDPFTDEYIAEQAAAVAVPMLEGRYTCVSCHDPHAKAGRKKLLRGEYLGLAGISKKINPHWKNVMCVSCHEGEPKKGADTLKEGGDLIRLCFRCHAFKYSRSDIHPVNVIPSRFVTVPPEMPLKEGRVTCSTCHDSSLQEGGERAGSPRRGNPKFLRGGFSTRNEFCHRCHTRQLMGLLNPHDQLDAHGRKDEIKCLFCHSSRPEGLPGWMVRRQFDGETVNQLCLLCHPDRYQNEHPLAPHFVTPSRAVTKALETSEERMGVSFTLINERVVCVTCHNPHQEGVMDETEETGKSGVLKRLRVGGDICAGCHP